MSVNEKSDSAIDPQEIVPKLRQDFWQTHGKSETAWTANRLSDATH